MNKELNIENIKKELMDKLLNNVHIINFFREHIERYTVPISKLYNNFIFDYASSRAVGDYIAVDVAEYDSPTATTTEDRRYVVTIKMGLKREENVCEMSKVITDIINSLYPDRKNFSNIPFVTVNNCFKVNDNGYSPAPVLSMVSLENGRESQLHRMITFSIEN